MRCLGITVVGAIYLVALFTGTPTDASAGDASGNSKGMTQGERDQSRARALRERSAAAAGAQVGYGTVEYPNTATSDPDTYYVLSLQIERLAEMIQALRTTEAQRKAAGEPARAGAIPTLPVSAPLADVKTVYGPEGPTEKSVRLLLEYRLMVVGNPRLKIGKINDNPTHVTAQIVTVDGSLVEEYSIDKENGTWKPVR